MALDGRVSHTVVAELLHRLGYSLQGNVKTREGRQHVDRDVQFRSVARRVRRAQRQQQSTISVDTKKKELVGAFKNAGRTWRPAKTPQRVQVHDFVIPDTATTGGKAIPCIYICRNEGWVSVGIDHDTASFAVRSYPALGQHGSPGVSTSPVAVDHSAGEQRGAPPVVEVGTAELANRTLVITVDFPPGTSIVEQIGDRYVLALSRFEHPTLRGLIGHSDQSRQCITVTDARDASSLFTATGYPGWRP